MGKKNTEEMDFWTRDEFNTFIKYFEDKPKYFSQDAVIKLAPRAGIELDERLTPAEKLKVVQALMEKDDPRAQAVFHDTGEYLAYTVVQYSKFYDIKQMMVLGRVMSGKGGEEILSTCQNYCRTNSPLCTRGSPSCCPMRTPAGWASL